MQRARRLIIAAALAGAAGLSGCSAMPDMFGDIAAVFDRDPGSAPAAAKKSDAAAEPALDPGLAETRLAATARVDDAEAAPTVSPDAAAAADRAAQPALTAAAAPGPDAALALSYPEPEACRTVRLYKKPRIAVSKQLPEEWRAFAGHWGDGLWDGKLCQELVIDQISEDGVVTLYDMQGYYTPWKRVPTAFRRTGQFLPDGRLRVDLGKMGVATYELQDGRLYGVYDWGVSTARIALVRK